MFMSPMIQQAARINSVGARDMKQRGGRGIYSRSGTSSPGEDTGRKSMLQTDDLDPLAIWARWPGLRLWAKIEGQALHRRGSGRFSACCFHGSRGAGRTAVRVDLASAGLRLLVFGEVPIILGLRQAYATRRRRFPSVLAGERRSAREWREHWS